MTLPITGSPDITSLDFNILYDISGATPAITLTNASVGNPSGTTRLNLCTWWYQIYTPSGTPIHEGDATTPDVATANWTTLSIPSGSWPTPFGNPPCGQIEFSCSGGYVCTLFVKDSANNIYSLSKTTNICRPNGNTQNTCGSFGTSAVSVTVSCNKALITCIDTTNYAYKSMLQPTSKSNSWNLTYPQDDNGNTPTPGTATNTPNVNFPVGYSSKGYRLNVRNTAIYDFGDGTAIKIQYKASKDFGVYCNIDLCQLQCQMQKFYKLSRQQCGTLVDPTIMDKMTRMNTLFNVVITGILQPLCGIDVQATIDEIKTIGDFQGDCGCASTPGINLTYPTGPSTGGSGCCPVSANVLDIDTGNAPAACPNSYFPANVYDPTGVTIIGSASNANDLIAIINGNASWQAYGVAFPEGNCKVGWFTINPATTPPPVLVELIVLPTPPPVGTITSDIIDGATDNPPAACPSSFYPATVNAPDGTTSIGTAYNINDLVAIVNGNAQWQAYGTAFNAGNCKIGWFLKDNNNLPPDVVVDIIVIPTPPFPLPTITVDVIDKDTDVAPSACPGSYFPVILYGPDGTTGIGTAYDITGLVIILNNYAPWQAYGTAVVVSNCKVGWNVISATNLPPVVKVAVIVVPPPPPIPPITVDVLDKNTGIAPASCPGSYFPARVYDPAGTSIIGLANSVSELIAILNGNASWATYGTAFPVDYCHVSWSVISVANLPPDVLIDTTPSDTGCVGGKQLYTVTMTDVCGNTSPITSSSFPTNATVDFGSGSISIGTVSSKSDLITKLNAATGKPSVITFSDVSGVPSDIQIGNSDCTVYSGSITVKCDAGSSSYILLGANHGSEIPTTIAPTHNGEYGFAVRTNTLLGGVPLPAVSQNDRMFHAIVVGGLLVTAESNTGIVYFYDITNPLSPILLNTIQLSSPAGLASNFSGTPNTPYGSPSFAAQPSLYSLYFPTDFYSSMSLDNIVVVEGVTGSIWILNYYTSEEVYADQNNLLLGKCPRVILNNRYVYFTQDGSLEQDAGLVSGVGIGYIVTFDTVTQNLNTVLIFQNDAARVWAASYDGSQYIYFLGVSLTPGATPLSVAKLDRLGPLTRYYTVLYDDSSLTPMQAQMRTSIKYVFGNIYISIMFRYGSSTGVTFFPVSQLGVSTHIVPTRFQDLSTALGLSIPVGSMNAFNVTPLGQCMVALTTSGFGVVGATGTKGGVIALYKTDGTIVSAKQFDTDHSFYNVIAIPNVSNYTPNSFV